MNHGKRRPATARKAVAVLTLLAFAQGAAADNILRRTGAASGSAAAPADGAALAAANAAARAAAAAAAANSPLGQALDAIKRFQAQQDAARAAAQGAPASVPNGIGVGGLDIAPGATPGSQTWQGAALPTQVAQDGRTTVTVTQIDPKAILTWKTFNVGRETELHFDQTAGGDSVASWIALNRVMDPSLAPSLILGSIKAEGQVYVINRNGIIFGGTSQVNVASLIASGLELNGGDQRFKDGLLSKPGIAFGGDGLPGGSVTTEAGARLTVGGYGQALLLGSSVRNAGSIEAPDGQVVLAAGSEVYIDRAIDQRGHQVDVKAGTAGSRAENTGIVSTPRGNVTMAGGVIQQDGLVTSTTSVEAAGSIVLGSPRDISLAQPVEIHFGGGSVTQVLPDEGGKKLVGTSQFTPSHVDVFGEKIDMRDGATIYAPSGSVTLSTTAPSQGGLDQTRVYVGTGARIDVSGLRDVDVAMEQNTIQGELRANELRDNPVLRDGPLRGRKVWFDARSGVTLGDLSGYYDIQERGIQQLMTSGGSVTLLANEIITRQGSVIDLSGGSLRFRDGYVTSTSLIDASGQVVRIEDAVAGARYVGILGDYVDPHARWGLSQTFSTGLSQASPRFEKGYEEGRSAGKLTIGNNSPYGLDLAFDPSRPHPDPSATGTYRVFDGDVTATTVVGPKQVVAPSGSTDPTRAWKERPAGAVLDIQRGGDIRIGGEGPQLGPDFTSDGSLAAAGLKPYDHLLPGRWFDGRTFTRVSIASGYTDDGISNSSGSATRNLAPGGHLAIAADVLVDLGDQGSFSFSGKGADIEGTIRAGGGSVSIKTLDGPLDPTDGASASSTVRLGATGLIDVAGRWTNQHTDAPETPWRALDGGNVSLSGSDVILEKGSLVDVGGGARLDVTGIKLTRGNAGAITLDVSRSIRPAGLPSGQLVLDGTLRAYAAGKGGSLSIFTLDAIAIGEVLPDDALHGTRLFTPSFFTQGGFSAYSLVGVRGVKLVQGITLAPSVEQLQLVLPSGDVGGADPSASVSHIASGARLFDIATRQVAPEGLRAPMVLDLSSIPRGSTSYTPAGQSADVSIGPGASVDMNPGSTVRVSASGTASVDGAIQSLGGTIELTAVDLSLSERISKVHVGPEALLSVAGYEKVTPGTTLDRRSVESGGTITLSSKNEVSVDDGAILAASGTRGVADLPSGPDGSLGGGQYVARTVDGDAGTISISGLKGVVAGTLQLAPGGDAGRGGLLRISTPQGMVVRQEAPATAGPGLTVVADSVNRSGADHVVLATISDTSSSITTGNVIAFQGDVALTSRRSLILQSPFIQSTSIAASGVVDPGQASTVTLTSDYVLFQGGRGPTSFPGGQVGGTLAANLTVTAGLIDVRNAVWLGCATADCTAGGFKTARFASRGDIRLSDQGLPGYRVGLFTPGNLEFDSAQIYVTSRQQAFTSNATQPLERNASDPGFLVQAGGRITVVGNGAEAPVPLSFGERLTLRAPVIVQGGVVRAPQGQLRLEGSESVSLLPGSLTSASLEGSVVPFGEVATGGDFRGYELSGWAPAKSITLSAPSVEVKKGAVVDLAGGGDLLGFRFSPGNGGSKDILASLDGFAVVPSLGTGAAPVGGVDALQNGRLAVGDAIWLQGVPGLADGTYTLLPAHYALLPGGFLIQPQAGSYASPAVSGFRPDGSVIASGYRAVSGLPVRDPGYGRFVVMSKDVIASYGEMVLYSFDQTVNRRDEASGLSTRTPRDSGSAIMSASTSLVLDGSGRFGAGADGLPGNLDISAPRIAVVASGGAPPGDGYLVLEKQSLEGFGAGSVLLGGVRSQTSTGTAVAVNATDVVVDTGAASPWTGHEILLAATGTVSVADGSIIRAQGTAAGDANTLQLSGNGALVRISSGERVGVVRTGASGATGDLLIGGATLAADGSLTLDGSRNVAIAPAAALSGRQFDVASVRVNLGDVPQGEKGTTLGPGTLALLAASSDLLIRGNDSIHLYGDLSLGSRNGAGQPSVEKITFDTGLLQGHPVAGGTAHVTVGDLTLRNSGAATQDPGASGSGFLALDLDVLHLGPGQVQVAGYSAMQGRTGAIEARGTGGLQFAGDLSLAAGQVRAASGANYGLDVGGAVALTRDTGPTGTPGAASLGGRLAVDGASVLVDTSVVLPAGSFEATARAGSVRLGSDATIDVRGAAVDFQELVRFAPGGTIQLSATGDVRVDPGAVLDVSGSARGGDAGRIGILATGQAAVEGDLRGSVLAGNRGGSFALDAESVQQASAFSTLNARLEGAGFDESRTYRLRQQDITLGAGDRIGAHDVMLWSDSGRVTIAGEIAAGGTVERPDGGRVQIVAGSGVVLEGTARLDASAGAAPAGGFVPASGKVEIAANDGRVDVAPGSVIDVTGGRSGGGEVVVRAPRQGNDVAIDRLGGDIRGAREIVVQGQKRYDTGSVDSILAGTMIGEASAWEQTGASTVHDRLAAGNPALARLEVAPAMLVKSGGDLAVQGDIDLSRVSGGAGTHGFLGLAAAGSIGVGAVVSDGFSGGELAAGRSFGIDLESGGDITLQKGAMIRTGSGDISLRAGRDIELLDPTSVIYTAGRKTAPAPGFMGAPGGAMIGEFPTEGGDLDLRAGRDVLAPLATQTTSAWLFRYGATSWKGNAASSPVTEQTSWSVVFGNFEQGLGALGGGDVRVHAGRDAVQLQVAIPTTGHLTTDTMTPTVAKASDLVVRGGGSLDLSAGRDVLGGIFMLGRGHADVRAGGNVLPSASLLNLRSTPDAGSPLNSRRKVGVLFGLMDATVTVNAGSTVDIEGVFDPMMQGQVTQNRIQGANSGTAFAGYTERTALEAISASGTVTYENDPWASVDLSQAGSKAAYHVGMSGTGDASLNERFARAPATLRLTSLESSVVLGNVFSRDSGPSPIKGRLSLAPAALGTMELLARQDARILLDVELRAEAPEFRRGPLQPMRYAPDPRSNADQLDVGAALSGLATNNSRGIVPIHADDPGSVRVYALGGSVCADISGACIAGKTVNEQSYATLSLPKPIDLVAGNDIYVGDYQVQHNGPEALTTLQAGRDVFDVGLEITGQGAAILRAGRNVTEHALAGGSAGPDFPWGGVIVSKGNNARDPGSLNLSLPSSRAADVYVMAGAAAGVDHDAFAAAYLDPVNGKGVVKTYLPELASYMKGLGYSGMTDAELVAAFKALPSSRREIFLDGVYFTELKQTGIDYNDARSPRFHSFERGFRAVSTLFPTDPSTLAADGAGSVILGGKSLETWASGGVTVMAPYGRVEVGSLFPPKGFRVAAGGVVTRRGGDVRIMSDQNIDLFTSRVFTLQGGDITMWTTNGSITAGSGSKTAVFNVPLSYVMSNDGVVNVDAFGLQTGSGIGVLDAIQNAGARKKSRLDLIAPRGEVNAGDAGIRVIGDINLAALTVVGVENISVSGNAAGVPKVEAPNLGAMTTASQVSAAATKEGVGPEARPRTTAADLPSIITVEVVGYETTKGEGDEAPAAKKKKRGDN